MEDLLQDRLELLPLFDDPSATAWSVIKSVALTVSPDLQQQKLAISLISDDAEGPAYWLELPEALEEDPRLRAALTFLRDMLDATLSDRPADAQVLAEATPNSPSPDPIVVRPNVELKDI